MSDYVVECDLKNDGTVEIIDYGTNAIFPNLFRMLVTMMYLTILYKTYNSVKNIDYFIYDNKLIHIILFLILGSCLGIYFIDITSNEYKEKIKPPNFDLFGFLVYFLPLLNLFALGGIEPLIKKFNIEYSSIVPALLLWLFGILSSSIISLFGFSGIKYKYFMNSRYVINL